MSELVDLSLKRSPWVDEIIDGFGPPGTALPALLVAGRDQAMRSEEHTSELQSL